MGGNYLEFVTPNKKTTNKYYGKPSRAILVLFLFGGVVFKWNNSKQFKSFSPSLSLSFYGYIFIFHPHTYCPNSICVQTHKHQFAALL